MRALAIKGFEVDSCPKCFGVFLDAEEGKVISVDADMLFGFGARPRGPSSRSCPDHGKLMAKFHIATSSGDVEVERADCCGGMFLDAGEGYAIAAGVVVPGAPASRSEPLSVTSSPAPASRSALACPACGAALATAAFHEVEVDECSGCAAFFLDSGEAELCGYDTEALFVDEVWGAPCAGASELRCPQCQESMTRYEPAILGPIAHVHHARCCSGVWMKRADDKDLRAASRVAVMKRADLQFEAGETVQRSAASRTKAEDAAAKVAIAASKERARESAQAALFAVMKHQRRRYEHR